jgi:hypothetical protein
LSDDTKEIQHTKCSDCGLVIAPGESHLVIDGKAYCEPCVKKGREKPTLETKMAESELRAKHPILKYFSHAHLPEKLAAVSQPWCDLAWKVAAELPDGAEKATALRKLLEGKDAAVRTLV